jgi:hypothetical protein
MTREAATITTVVLALLAGGGLLDLWFATGYGYLDDPPSEDSTIHDAWLWVPAGLATVGLVLAATGIGRERRAVWAAGALLLATPALVAVVSL